jgi:hypothetical protein
VAPSLGGGAAADGWGDDDDELLDMEDEAEKQVRGLVWREGGARQGKGNTLS